MMKDIPDDGLAPYVGASTSSAMTVCDYRMFSVVRNRRGPSGMGVVFWFVLICAVLPIGLPVVGFAGSYPEDVGIGLEYRDVADRGDGISVKQRFPGGAVVNRLPQAAGGKSHVEDEGIAFDGLDVVNAASHTRRPD